MIAVKALAHFHIVTHSSAASFLIKLILCETNIFYLVKYTVSEKTIYIFCKFIQNKG